MHIVKSFIALTLAIVSGTAVCTLVLLCTINLPEWINGPPEYPVMPIGQFFLTIIFGIIAGVFVLIVLLKRYVKLSGSKQFKT
ncbi:MAG: hypothetical protein V4450_07625 [Bacteroidota bacterium]